MNYKNPKNLDGLKKVIKNLTVFCAVIFTSAIIFYSPNISSQTSALPDCATSTSNTPKPGNDCLFYGKKLCNDIPSAPYPIEKSRIIQAPEAIKHRDNCYDLSDLPLCSQIDDGHQVLQSKNCVRECSDVAFANPDPSASPPLVRGIDYAVHNRDCIRFSNNDPAETGLQTKAQADAEPNPSRRFYINDPNKPDLNSTSRKCHQLAATTLPNSTSSNQNCEIIKCNLLSPDELNEVRISNGAQAYCDGDVKCYNFSRAQLPFTKFRPTNSMCKIHDCKPTTTSCGADDTKNITDKEALYPGYLEDYKLYINAKLAITNTYLCNPIICKPVIQVQYRCLPYAATTPTERNRGENGVGGCDETGDGSICKNGYCYATIDCNLAKNNSAPECVSSDSTPDGITVGTNDDKGLDSWFYRPIPLPKALDANGLISRSKMTINLDADYTTAEGRAARFCYTQEQLEENGYGWHDTLDLGALGTVNFGFFHSYLRPDKSRSPGICRSSLTSAGSRLDDRGNGYIYLCGNDGNLYSKPSKHTAYHKGYVSTEFKEKDATHTITVCLRFKNLGFPQDITWADKQSETCGERECGISCGFGLCRLEACGKDMCFNLVVSDLQPQNCIMSDNNFDGNTPESNCQIEKDTYLRLRAVKYGESICTFLDLKGALAYATGGNNDNFNGQEKLANGACVSGVANDAGGCDGAKDTNDRPGLASKWRTVLQIPYILNNRPAGQAQGYLNSEGRLFPAQECMRVPLRVAPPFTPNLATADNAAKLFVPPVYIVSAKTIKDGDASIPSEPTESLGTTDFHYPEIEVRFGTDVKKLSLGMEKIGTETTNADPNGSATLTTKVSGKDYSVEVFVKKQFKTTTNTPIFCLYKKVKDSAGKPLDPTRVQCVDRTLPEIDSSKAIIGLKRKVMAYPDPSNTYRSSKIVLRYLANFGTNKIDNSCSTSSDDVCSAEIKITNPDSAIETCDSSIDAYEICAKRDPCTKLNIECIKNELDMHIAKNAGQPLTSFLAVRDNCNKLLLPSCNALKGITTASDASVTTMGESSGVWPSATNLRYGWFNELCITKGFERKLKRIIAYKLDDNTKGKCRVDLPKPGANCIAGGKAPDCPCAIAVDEDSAGVGEIIRPETPHEAGLCIDMPLPKTCSPIDYNPEQNLDLADLEYVASSIGQISYGLGYSSSLFDISNVVHLSHKFRTDGSVSSPAILLRGHAEFPLGILGMNDIEGECKGFWKAQKSSTGFISKPKINCLDVSGNAQWDINANVTAPCVRYFCPEISTTGPDRNGDYQGNYDSGEADKEKRGLSHGFALWNKVTSSDFPITSTSDRCITGYKLKNAATKTASGIVSGTAAIVASRNNQITGYASISEGATPVFRVCNQLGQWQIITNSCERIRCLPIDPPIPTSDNRAAWIEWNSSHSAGARFGVATDEKGKYVAVAEKKDPVTQNIITPACNTLPCYTYTLASKNLPSVPPFFPPESTAKGTCVESLGFFQSPGASPPTRKCDHLGNWLKVENPCVTACQKVEEPPSSDPYSAANSNANGFSTWAGVEGLEAGVSAVVQGACTTKTDSSGKPYFQYPYPPLRDDGGIPYTLSSTLNLAQHKIPFDVTIDTTRPATLPKRTCTDYFGAGGEIKAHRWSAPSSSCISKCPGSDTDPRIGVGRTLHNRKTSAATNVTFEIAINDAGDKLNIGTYAVPAGQILIDWPSTSFDEWAFATQMGAGTGGISSQSVRDYESGRANGKFILARKCNATTHQWESPVVLCALNSNNDLSNGNTLSGSNAVFPNFPPNASSKPLNTTSYVSERDIVTGTCKTEFYPSGKDLTYSPKYQCSAKDATRNIDEFFFSLTSGAACTKYCSTLDATFTSKLGTAHVYLLSANDLVLPGAKLSFDCAAGNGQEISGQPLGGGWNTGVNHNCGRSPTERINILPSITCNADSVTWDDVTNPCSACRKCSFDEGAPDIIGDTSIRGTSYGACAYFDFTKGWNKLNCLGTSIESNKTVTCSATTTCPHDPGFIYEMQYLDVTGSCSFQCLDGAFVAIKTGIKYQWQ